MSRRSRDREVARRRQHAARRRPAPPGATPVTPCVAGNDPAVCCVGDPWGRDDLVFIVRQHGEPLPPEVITTAAAQGIEPHALDHHVEGVHGWEPHDVGYDRAVTAAAACLLEGGCT